MELEKSMAAQLNDAIGVASDLFDQMRRLATRARLPEREGLTEEPAARQDAHNIKASAVRTGCDQALEGVRLHFEKVGKDDTVGDLAGYTEGARFERCNLAEELCRVAVQRLEIAEVSLGVMQTIAASRAAEAEKVVAKVKVELEKIGCGLEAQVASAHGNARAAEAQLDHLARNGNLRGKAAMLAPRNAKAEVEGAQSTLQASHEILRESRALLVKVAVKSLVG